MKTFKTLGRNIGNQKYKLFQKYGSAEKTVDEHFEEMRLEWLRLSKSLENIQKNLVKQDFIKNYGVPLQKVAELLSDFYEDDAEMADYAVKYTNVSYKVENAMREFLERQDTIQILLLEYLACVKAYKKNIKERDTFLLEFDKNRGVFQQVTEKQEDNTPQFFQAEHNFNASRATYEKYNEELTRMISDLCERRYDEFQPIYRTMLFSQIALFNRISEAYNTLEPPVYLSEGNNKQMRNSVSSNTSYNTEAERMSSSRLDPDLIKLKVAHDRPSLTANARERFMSSVPAGFLTNSWMINLIDMLLDPELFLMDCIIKTTTIGDADRTASSIVQLYSSIDWSIYIVKFAISLEVAYTKNSGSLLRANNTTGKLMYHYASSKAVVEWLKATLEAPIQYTLAYDQPIEIDPAKLDSGTEKENLDNLLSIARLFLDSIVNSNIPSEIRDVCSHLRSEVKMKFPESADVAVGAFLFLRLLTPIIVSGKVPQHSAEATPTELPYKSKRALLLISKILQQLVNFNDSFKEEYLKGASQFITERFSQMHKFFEEISIPGPPAQRPATTIEESRKAFLVLYEKLYYDREKIALVLGISDPKMEGLFERILDELGDKPLLSSSFDLSKHPSAEATVTSSTSINGSVQLP